MAPLLLLLLLQQMEYRGEIYNEQCFKTMSWLERIVIYEGITKEVHDVGEEEWSFYRIKWRFETPRWRLDWENIHPDILHEGCFEKNYGKLWITPKNTLWEIWSSFKVSLTLLIWSCYKVNFYWSQGDGQFVMALCKKEQ